MANAKGNESECGAVGGPIEPGIEEHGDRSTERISPENVGEEFAVGLYMTMWPKVEKCDAYVSMLLETQDQLHTKIKELTESLTGSENADSLDESQSPLVNYALRLKEFPNRVQALQAKLEGIRSLLNAVKIHGDAVISNVSPGSSEKAASGSKTTPNALSPSAKSI